MGIFADGFKELKKASEPLYKTPKSIQQTIEIMKVAENGIFEVAKNRFSKCYRFQDINYTTANETEQIDIFERYCKFLNSLDVNFKITINNKNKDMEQVRDYVFLQRRDDGYNGFRRIYNNIMEQKIHEGRQGIEQERYLTITIERKNFEETKAQFATIEASVHKAFGELGAEIVPLSGNERIKVLYDYYHLGDEGSFDFDIREVMFMSKVAVVYWSGTGNTEAMAAFVAEGAKGKGADVALLTSSEFDASMMDNYDASAFGCPPMGSEQLEESEFEPMFTSCEAKLRGKKIALFGSYGWGSNNRNRENNSRCGIS